MTDKKSNLDTRDRYRCSICNGFAADEEDHKECIDAWKLRTWTAGCRCAKAGVCDYCRLRRGMLKKYEEV